MHGFAAGTVYDVQGRLERNLLVGAGDVPDRDTPWCPKRRRRASCGFSMVVVQEAPEPRATDDWGICPAIVRGASLALDELAAKTLMETLGEVMVHEFLEHVA